MFIFDRCQICEKRKVTVEISLPYLIVYTSVNISKEPHVNMVVSHMRWVLLNRLPQPTDITRFHVFVTLISIHCTDRPLNLI